MSESDKAERWGVWSTNAAGQSCWAWGATYATAAEAVSERNSLERRFLDWRYEVRPFVEVERPASRGNVPMLASESNASFRSRVVNATPIAEACREMVEQAFPSIDRYADRTRWSIHEGRELSTRDPFAETIRHDNDMGRADAARLIVDHAAARVMPFEDAPLDVVKRPAPWWQGPTIEPWDAYAIARHWGACLACVVEEGQHREAFASGALPSTPGPPAPPRPPSTLPKAGECVWHAGRAAAAEKEK